MAKQDGNGNRARFDSERTPDGRFAKGNHGGPGRSTDDFIALARKLYDKHRLLEQACQIAVDKRVDAATRLRAIEFMTVRAFGVPKPSFEMTPSEPIPIKRIIFCNERL
jgi:hypothetical protein